MTDIEKELIRQLDEARQEIKRLSNIIFKSAGFKIEQDKVSSGDLGAAELVYTGNSSNNMKNQVNSRSWRDQQAAIEAIERKKYWESKQVSGDLFSLEDYKETEDSANIEQKGEN